MSTTEQWYIGQRAEALTKVLLTRRNDLVVTTLQDDNHGLDYRVEITADGQATGRIFGVQVKARLQALPKNAQIQVNGHTRDKNTTFTLPVCLFYFTMEDNGAYYRWIIEPVITDDQTPKLNRIHSDTLYRLNSEAVDHVISRINNWYERLYKTLSL